MVMVNEIGCHSGVEYKMGLRGSATSVLNFGDNGACRDELLGPEQKGIVVMFHMMNEQRLLVELQGLSQGSAAYLHALDFARERKQGGTFESKSFEIMDAIVARVFQKLPAFPRMIFPPGECMKSMKSLLT